MRLVALSLVKNECDIIEQFVRHNLRFVDALFIIDNQSSDGTREILRDLTHEGLPLVIFDDPRFTRMQSAQMTRLFRTVCAHIAADFILPLDADEMLSASSRREFEEELAKLPAATHGLIPWKTYLYEPETAESDPIRRMTWRRRVESPMYHKVIIATDSLDYQQTVIQPGNHMVTHAERYEPQHHVLSNLALAHFPVRSARQITAKAICGWLSILAMDPASAATGFGHQKRDLYFRLMQHPDLSDDDLATISLNYAQSGTPRTRINAETAVAEPLPITYTLRYAERAVPQPLVTLARTVENIVRPAMMIPFASRAPGTASARQLLDSWERRVFTEGEGPCIDLPPFKYVSERFRPESVADIGCGLGECKKMFEEWGASDVVGVDNGCASANFLRLGSNLSHNISQRFDLGRSFDLVICTQTADYVDEAYEDALLETVNRHARELILFSAAEPDQPGTGSINCKPVSHWLRRWQELGWTPDVFDSLAVRVLSTVPEFRRNLVVLKRAERAHNVIPGFEVADLKRIKSHDWCRGSHNQRTILYPLSEPVAIDEQDW